MAVIISGTPGTGKTTLAKKLAASLKWKYIDVNAVIAEEHLQEKYDAARQCVVVDVKKLTKALLARIKADQHLVIDSHLSHDLPSKCVDCCIITTCSLPVLKKRLEKRNYSKAKVRENLDAEIFQVCSQEALEGGHRVLTIDTTTKNPARLVKDVVKSLSIFESKA